MGDTQLFTLIAVAALVLFFLARTVFKTMKFMVFAGLVTTALVVAFSMGWITL